MHLTLYQERVSPTGSMMSTGILNQLGRPNLDILAVLIREAVQNSWDARRSNETPVKFGINGYTLDDAKRQYLIDTVFCDVPPVSSLPLAQLLHEAEYINTLMLYDRGTIGLGGTTRADEVSAEGEPNNFVNFIRNIGQPASKAFTGGTYGYGKSAFYRASEVRTICVYTRSVFRGELQSRFIAASLGEPYADSQVRYTGRSWWGTLSSHDTSIVEPILDEEADTVATALGMPLFSGDECGTNIMVMQPYFADRTPTQAVNFMAENLLWNFWPKLMVQNTGYPALNLEVMWQGSHIDIPAPEAYPPLKGFVEAMYLAKGGEDKKNKSLRSSNQTLNSTRPKQRLGQLALQEFEVTDKSAFDIGPQTNSLFGQLHHHTALMRQPELVVKYLPGLPLKDSTKGYAGVFICDKELDMIFSSAEPPTHDDWVPSSLESRYDRTLVSQTLRQTEREMSDFASVEVDVKELNNGNRQSGWIARRLGTLLFKNSHRAFSGNSVSSTGRKSLSKEDFSIGEKTLENGVSLHPIFKNHEDPSFSPEQHILDNLKQAKFSGRAEIMYNSQRLIMTDDGVSAVKVDFSVIHSPDSAGTLVSISTNILLDGNTKESSPPVGQELPKILYWSDPSKQRYPATDKMFVPIQVSELCSVVISIPGNVMLRIELSATPTG